MRRDEPTPYISLQLPIDPLIDSDHCQAISEHLENHGSPWEYKLATKDLADQIPDEPGLYMFVWNPALRLVCDDDARVFFRYVLYIGQAGAEAASKNTLRSRYQTEYANYLDKDPRLLWEQGIARKRHERLLKYLAVSPLEYWWSLIEDKEYLFISNAGY